MGWRGNRASGGVYRALRHHGGDGRLLHLDLDVVRDLQRRVMVADPGDPAEEPADGDDLVAHRKRRDQLAVRLLALLLRTDQQEIERTEHHEKHNHEAEWVALCGSDLGVGDAGEEIHVDPAYEPGGDTS